MKTTNDNRIFALGREPANLGAIGKGIAMAAMFLSGAILEVNGASDGGILLLAALLWAIFGNWNFRTAPDEDGDEKRSHVERLILTLPEADRAAFLKQYLEDSL